MAKRSAGILMYRNRHPGPEVLLDSIAGEIIFIQAYDFGLSQLGETPAVGYSRRFMLPAHLRSDEVDEQWSLVDSIVAGWARDRPAFPNYAAGTWGPAGSEELMGHDSREWLRH